MSQKINSFSGGGYIEFDTGNFDDWCVFVTKPDGERFAPTDVHYFSRMQKLGSKYGSQKIYDDFVVIFNRTSKNTDPLVFKLISTLCEYYKNDSREIEIWFNVLYAGMIAEENKQFAILKKRIKRLGMHQILIDNLEPEFAANFSKGKKWRDLDKLMKSKGF
ncbi:MAG: hypothetical protein L3J54_06430 [Draconibacterium sp.]|nr:hypothetical protein [Draconibacterium sp.]